MHLFSPFVIRTHRPKNCNIVSSLHCISNHNHICCHLLRLFILTQFRIFANHRIQVVYVVNNVHQYTCVYMLEKCEQHKYNFTFHTFIKLKPIHVKRQRMRYDIAIMCVPINFEFWSVWTALYMFHNEVFFLSHPGKCLGEFVLVLLVFHSDHIVW